VGNARKSPGWRTVIASRHRLVTAGVCALAVALVLPVALDRASFPRPSHADRPPVSLGANDEPATSPTGPATPSHTATNAATSAHPTVAWRGPVEHIFFHTLVVKPRLAFAGDRLGQGFRDYFVTVGEFKAILAQLYDNGWTLVDIHRAVNGTVRVPAGRKPLVLSEDDVNYYDYERPRGLGWRLALDSSGTVKVEIRDGSGVHLTDDDLVPLVDNFVAGHPDFSADGAKGVLALTGYQGLFGERIQDANAPDHAAAVTRARAIAGRLLATGWLLASHSYGHIDLTTTPTAFAQLDLRHWLTEDGPITGPTDIYVYPFGDRPPPATVAMLKANGFTVLCDIDVVPRLVRSNGVTVMSRRHIDGLALSQQAARLKFLFSVVTVKDHVR
jgi:hypothetical protein